MKIENRWKSRVIRVYNLQETTRILLLNWNIILILFLYIVKSILE